ncbi:MAG: nucleotidyltransferase domain-containing protein [Bdellovibrionaceae bacterium]|nr:nucleotidyltransferase domain-containing protein [Pseudobdellovibrionaceae bacterium]
MKFGLKESDLLFLQENLIQPLKGQGFKVYVFGSRATGKNHPFSDIDILLEGNVSSDKDIIIIQIKELFEESNFPYKIDLVKSENLAQSYRPSVMKDRVEV